MKLELAYTDNMVNPGEAGATVGDSVVRLQRTGTSKRAVAFITVEEADIQTDLLGSRVGPAFGLWLQDPAGSRTILMSAAVHGMAHVSPVVNLPTDIVGRYEMQIEDVDRRAVVASYSWEVSGE
jgi:hypothetical protein